MPDQETVLIIDDDPWLLRLVEYNLQEAGYRALTVEDGLVGLRRFFECKPDLVVLDITMPGMDGWTALQRIREVSDVPIIMLTAQAQQKDIIKGFELGADDYMVKPFEVRELLARIRAKLRRTETGQRATREDVEYSDGFLSINIAERRVIRDGRPLRLTKTEFDLLSELVRAAPRVATYRSLLENVWGFEYTDEIDYVRVYIWHLRRKIEPDPSNPVYIVNEQGVGYRFEKQVD